VIGARAALGPLVALAALALVAIAGAAPKPPLTHQGHWFVDAKGRVVILHGVNMVYKVGSYRPADAGFGADDAKFLRRQGFNTVRLGIIYKGLEPKPPSRLGKPQYRRGYIRSIAKTESVLADRGILSLLDFHQDLYNERFQGEGWPDWQVLDDGVPSEPQAGFPANYLVNAGLNRAFDNFWANAPVGGRGLQDLYAAAWRRVAAKFDRDPYVVGYDLLNEPWPGSAFQSDDCFNAAGCATFDGTTLAPFNERLIDAIRGVDPETLIFYEPLVTFDFGADSKLADTGDPAAGFSFHNYCLPASLGGPGSGPACEPLEDQVFANADQQSVETGDVPFLTEFGATDDLETIGRIVRLADAHMTSWQYWHYCACDDPTTSGPGVQALVIDARNPPRGANVNRAKLLTLARPYPRAVAGRPRSYGFDPATHRFQLVYSTRATQRGELGRRLDRGVKTEIFLPRIQYKNGYRVQISGARVVSEPGARVLKLERHRGADAVSAVVTPKG
jgi:endoglycosylceramidase